MNSTEFSTEEHIVVISMEYHTEDVQDVTDTIVDVMALTMCKKLYIIIQLKLQKTNQLIACGK